MSPLRLGPALLALGALTSCGTAASGPATNPAPGGATALVRVAQAGYTTTGVKIARVLSRAAVAGVPFAVQTIAGTVLLRGNASRDLGVGTPRLPHVAALDFSALKRRGTYRIVLSGAVRGRSPAFRIAAPGGRRSPPPARRPRRAARGRGRRTGRR